MNLLSSKDRQAGSTLAVVLVMCSVTLMILGSMLSWVSTSTTLSHRNNEYFRTVAVAEAATEKVIARITEDYKRGGDRLVVASATSYGELLPTAVENARFGHYKFSDGLGNAGRILVQNTAPTEFRVLSSQYRGLRGYSTPFTITAHAREADTLFHIPAGVRQDIEATAIPLFQFAIFYNIDLEVNPGPDMIVNGLVHGNENIYLQPQSTLTFQDSVTAAGKIINDKKAGDPSSRPVGKIVFQGERDSGTSSLNLPIGTDNTPAAVRKVIEPPPPGESPTSPLGSERLYNKADLIITIPASSSGSGSGAITVTSGIRDNKATTVPQAQWDAKASSAGFLKEVSFFNARENKTVTALEIDVGRLKNWSSQTTNVLRPTLPSGDVTVIYVDDKRAPAALTEPGVRLVNGAALPSKGLTVVTPVPLYVQGDYNTTDDSGNRSTGNSTTYTKPAALIGDAVTVLSGAWSDANSTAPLSSRSATDTTVNAAFLAGVVETTAGSYSGGVENFPRFLENWSGRNLTYNGSMVVMFPSQIARGSWRGTGDGYGIYNPPTRRWAFDTNFRDVTKLPPGTPMARKILRSVWATVKPPAESAVK